jgi:hypothetical protein
MPRKNIYIRNEDVSTWEAISNKSEWLHNALADSSIHTIHTPPTETKKDVSIHTPGVKGNQKFKDFAKQNMDNISKAFGGGAEDITEELYGSEPDPETPVQSTIGEKPCCALAPKKYCQHWQWNMETGDRYINQFSGRVSYEEFAG